MKARRFEGIFERSYATVRETYSLLPSGDRPPLTFNFPTLPNFFCENLLFLKYRLYYRVVGLRTLTAHPYINWELPLWICR